MKGNLLLGFIATLVYASTSFADFSFYSSAPNACETISGQWGGGGKANHWLIGTCLYQGIGKVSTLDKAGNFTLDITATKNSGNHFCPNQINNRLNAKCVNGFVTIKTEYGNLTGNFTKTSGDAKGELAIAPAINVDLALKFSRTA